MKTQNRELDDARYEAERYREEADRLRRQEARRDNEREERRKKERLRNDPSSRLYNGDVSDFHEAIRCHIACLQREILPADPRDDPDMQELSQRCNQRMREGIVAANKAQVIYDSVMKDAQARVVADLRAAKLMEWADCLESGDYSAMAV